MSMIIMNMINDHQVCLKNLKLKRLLFEEVSITMLMMVVKVVWGIL